MRRCHSDAAESDPEGLLLSLLPEGLLLSLLQRLLAARIHPPDKIKKLEAGNELYYIDATLMKPDEETLAKLDHFKLREDSSNIMVRATCYGTIFFCQHPWRLSRAATMAFNAEVKNTFSNMSTSTCSIWSMYWPKDTRKKLHLPQSDDVIQDLETDHVKELLGWLSKPSEPAVSIDIIDVQELWKGKPMTFDNSYFAEATTAKPE